MTTFDWSQYTGNLNWLKERTIYMTRAGSHSYGTNIEGSDEDYRGVCIAPPEYYLGTMARFEQAEEKNPDLTVFCLRKFIHLAAQANPNVIELLFTDPSDQISPEPIANYALGRRLFGMRHLFVTKKARYTYSGYAVAQLKKIKHNTEHSIEGSPRWERIQKFGYCTKNAMHLVRLLRMCREILETGQVRVKRADAAELLAIRNGAWTLEELVKYAE